ncbi:acyl carrier protein [Sphingobium amiense]|uniref:acyl carrier protein n=1 Tax=Sphingobium amiense TaxID=135719 RepID=UPI00083530A8|nr:acyl carrier protein [Sphingobium amiense]
MQVPQTQPVDRTPDVENRLRALLRDVLGLSQERVDAFDDDTPLFGALPELDSMAVAGLLTEMEDRFGFLIDDEDIDGDTFETFGSLLAFTTTKVG